MRVLHVSVSQQSKSNTMKYMFTKIVALAFAPSPEVKAQLEKADKAIMACKADITKNTGLFRESVKVVKETCRAEIQLAVQKCDDKIDQLNEAYKASDAELRQQLNVTRAQSVATVEETVQKVKVEKLQNRLEQLRARAAGLQMVPA